MPQIVSSAERAIRPAQPGLLQQRPLLVSEGGSSLAANAIKWISAHSEYVEGYRRNRIFPSFTAPSIKQWEKDKVMHNLVYFISASAFVRKFASYLARLYGLERLSGDIAKGTEWLG